MWATNIGIEHGQVLMSVLDRVWSRCWMALLHGTEMLAFLLPRHSMLTVTAAELHLCISTWRPGPFFISGVYDFSCSYMYNIDGFRYSTMSLTFYCQCFLGWTYDTSCAAFPMAAPLISINCTVCSWGSWASASSSGMRLISNLLKTAKRAEMIQQCIQNPSEDDVIRRLSTAELALHCKRVTRGTAETTRLISSLLESLDGPRGFDTQGVPLFDSEKIQQIWKIQSQHVPCIQDPLVWDSTHRSTHWREAALNFLFTDVQEAPPLWKAFISIWTGLFQVRTDSTQLFFINMNIFFIQCYKIKHL